MAKVLGLGGFFYRARDPDALREWYARVLGMEFKDWGGVWFPATDFAAHADAGTVMHMTKQDTDFFDPSKHDYMFNLVVDDLAGVLARCKAEGVEPIKLFPEEINGSFAHILDPEGRKIELWQPKPMPAS